MAILCASVGLASLAYAQSSNAPNGSVSTSTWQPIGPAAVQTPDFDLVTGRVTTVTLDPSDVTGNRLYVGTTGGGVWVAQNAATSNTSSIAFTPLTDYVQSLTTARDGSISIGAITVQPGGTGVILPGPATRMECSTLTTAPEFCVRPTAAIRGRWYPKPVM